MLGNELTFSEFEQFLIEKKDKLTAIKDLRSLWTAKAADSKQEIFNKIFRILSFKFFREDAVAYIYSSHKIKNTRALITYRFILQRALHDPESFSFMKFQNWKVFEQHSNIFFPLFSPSICTLLQSLDLFSIFIYYFFVYPFNLGA